MSEHDERGVSMVSPEIDPVAPPAIQVARPSPAPRARLPWWGYFSLLGNLVALSAIPLGFLHIIYGGGQGCHVIVKETWGIENTFVNAGAIIGHSRLELLDRAALVRAMMKADLISFPDAD